MTDNENEKPEAEAVAASDTSNQEVAPEVNTEVASEEVTSEPTVAVAPATSEVNSPDTVTVTFSGLVNKTVTAKIGSAFSVFAKQAGVVLTQVNARFNGVVVGATRSIKESMKVELTAKASGG